MSVLNDLQEAVASVATAVGPSVVGIGRHQRGSGVVVADGRVLTNAHNLRGDEVTVTLRRRPTAVGTVKGVDQDGDLAVIAVDTDRAHRRSAGRSGRRAERRLRRLRAPPPRARRARGSPSGIVSAVGRAFRGPGGRRISGSIEHTAPLASGSSGGALLDAEGRFVGLNTNRIGDGFYLALPADAALRERVDSLGRRHLGRAAAAGHRDRPGIRRPTAASLGRPARTGTGCSSGGSRTTARRHAAGIPGAT